MDRKPFPYEEICRECLAKIGRIDVPAVVMIGTMRDQYGVLDALDERTFMAEAEVAAEMWDTDPTLCRRLAELDGMTVGA